jgi:2'-5' RNA ligase
VRLFAAVRPPATVLDHLDLALRTVGAGVDTGERSSPLQWTAAENRHLTVSFYGAVPDALIDEVADGLGAVASASRPFELRLRGAGVFSHRTLWVGAAGDVEAMRRLVDHTVRVGADLGTRPDDRVRSRPHLTVGRVAPSARSARRGRRPDAGALPGAGVGALVRALAVYEGPPWRVEELLLLQSQPGAGRGGGPLYTTVGTWRFGSGDASSRGASGEPDGARH